MKKKTAAPDRTLSRKLAEHHAKLSYSRIPAGSRHAMKRLLLDYIGVAIAGSQTESGVIAREFATLQGKALEATLIGGGERVPVTAASFANAISCHSIELDDIDVLALFHFSPPVFSSALAMAEATGANGKDLLTALAAGCEVMERVSMAANNDLRNRAFHTDLRRVRGDGRCRQAAATDAGAADFRLRPCRCAGFGPDGNVRPVDAKAF
jgi:2-methylcitrate dehydratase PrpD